MNDMFKPTASIFEPPHYVDQYEVFPKSEDDHECEPGHCSNNPLLKPVKGCYPCKQYSQGFGQRPACGHMDFVIVPTEAKR